MRFALKIAYLGSQYHGWQRQPNVITVEGTILQTLKKFKVLYDLKKTKYGYASRTDASVHSLSQVIAFNTKKELNFYRINDSLPPDICILSMRRVPPSFHPRYDYKQKTYRFVIPYRHENLNCMRRAAQFLEGTHDFSSFVKATLNGPRITTITNIDIHKERTTLILDFSSNWGFFWQQVRRMVTFLIFCGHGEISPDETIEYLNKTKFPKLPPASPHRLILKEVSYSNIIFDLFSKTITKLCRYLESTTIPPLILPEIINEFMKYLGQ
ncbi:MAG: tRNA pseudouridine(38-40) synthase TruA [Candidatus Heimdallarchaeota archaeon]